MSAVLSNCGIVPYESTMLAGLMALAREMHAESVYAPIRLDEAKLREQFNMAVINPNVYLRVWMRDGEIDGGLWGFLAAPYWTKEVVAYDRAWFVRPGRRGTVAAVRLLRDFEAWAKAAGVRFIMPGQTTGIKVDETSELFQNLGYRVVGCNAMKGV